MRSILGVILVVAILWSVAWLSVQSRQPQTDLGQAAELGAQLTRRYLAQIERASTAPRLGQAKRGVILCNELVLLWIESGERPQDQQRECGAAWIYLLSAEDQR